MTDDSRALLELFSLHVPFEHALFEAGGFLDQPAVLIEAMALIHSETQLVKEYLTEQAEEQAKRAAAAKSHKRAD